MEEGKTAQRGEWIKTRGRGGKKREGEGERKREREREGEEKIYAAATGRSETCVAAKVKK